MEMIIISGAGTMALLVALLVDDVLAPDLRRPVRGAGRPRNSATEWSTASPPSPDAVRTYERAA